MQIEISGTHVEITPALRDFTTGKLGRLERHYNHILNISVNLKVEKAKQTAHAKVAVPGETIDAESDAADLYSAVDLLVDKLDRQLVKYKEKHEHHRG